MKLTYSLLITFLLLSVLTPLSAQDKMNVINLKTPEDQHDFFRFTSPGTTIISGHRGGMVKGFPENSIQTFEHTLRFTPAFFEIDPRLTKDSVIVLMHDATLDRTTTGTGKLSDYTFAEIRQLRLKDTEGNITDFQIPTLAEAIEWARGKTVLNLDHKDVSLGTTSALIKKLKAEAFVMLTVHSPAEARFYLGQNKKSMFSCAIKTKQDYEAYEKAGIPFRQMIAYIGPLVKPENQELYQLLNNKGTMCMISSASSYDKLKTEAERNAAYISILQDGASILETDYPIEAALAISALQKTDKSKFYGKQK